jgi:hypothetical protein
MHDEKLNSSSARSNKIIGSRADLLQGERRSTPGSRIRNRFVLVTVPAEISTFGPGFESFVRVPARAKEFVPDTRLCA